MNRSETQNDSAAQLQRVPVLREDSLVFPEDDALTNCALCSKLTPPSASRLCADCETDHGSDSLARLADRLLAEPDSPLDEALKIASGEDRLTLPTRAHLKALYEQLQRSDRYAQALEQACSLVALEAERIKDGLQALSMTFSETEAVN